MSSSSWRDLYREGERTSLGSVTDIDENEAIARAKDLAKEIDKDFWVCKGALLYFAHEHYPKSYIPIAHVYPGGRVEWRVEK